MEVVVRAGLYVAVRHPHTRGYDPLAMEMLAVALTRASISTHPRNVQTNES